MLTRAALIGHRIILQCPWAQGGGRGDYRRLPDLGRKARNEDKEGQAFLHHNPPYPWLNLKPGTERGRKRHLFKAKAGDQTTLPAWVALGNLELAPRGLKGQWV